MENIFIKKQQITDFTLLKDYCFFNSKDQASIFSKTFDFLIQSASKNTDSSIVFANLTHQYTYDELSKSCMFSDIEHFRSHFYNKKLIEKNTYAFQDSEDNSYCIRTFNGALHTNIPQRQYKGFSYITIAMDNCILQYKMDFIELRLLTQENDFLKQVQVDCQKYNLDLHLLSNKNQNHKVKI